MGGQERTHAVWRDVHRGRVWRAQACRVVEDSPETIADADAQLPEGWDRV
jgi:hypothetical protein